MKTIQDLMDQKLPFIVGQDVFYPTEKFNCTLIYPDYQGLFLCDYNIDMRLILGCYLKDFASIDYFEGVPSPIKSIAEEIQVIYGPTSGRCTQIITKDLCACDFYSVILPYGCQCGGK